jgi:selenide,water dikinase
VTGFGLLGHLGNILAASGVGARIEVSRLPVLAQALDLAAMGCVPGGTQRNHDAARAAWSADLTPAERYICTDAQTSGGLLLAVAPEKLDALIAALKAERTLAAAVIGEILPESNGLSVVRGAAEQ